MHLREGLFFAHSPVPKPKDSTDMPTIVVALKDIITDADPPIDLTTLPEPKAVQPVKNSNGFLSAYVQLPLVGRLHKCTTTDR